jgi:hypothetical protein
VPIAREKPTRFPPTPPFEYRSPPRYIAWLDPPK